MKTHTFTLKITEMSLVSGTCVSFRFDLKTPELKVSTIFGGETKTSIQMFQTIQIYKPAAEYLEPLKKHYWNSICPISWENLSSYLEIYLGWKIWKVHAMPLSYNKFAITMP